MRSSGFRGGRKKSIKMYVIKKIKDDCIEKQHVKQILCGCTMGKVLQNHDCKTHARTKHSTKHTNLTATNQQNIKKTHT